MKPITVNVPVRVTIDADAWTENYGVEGTNAIRKDVKAYVQNGVYAQLDELGVLAPADSYIDLSRPEV